MKAARWTGVLAGLLCGAVGCGSASSSPGAQFCQSWAGAFCQKLYACTPADQRGTNFLGGSSQSQCTSIWTQACTDPQPKGTTFDVNCSGGAHVNTSAKTACLNELATISCDDFNSPTYVSVCDQVCAGASDDGGAGGRDGAGGAGGAPTDPVSFCEALNRKACALAFDCTPAASMDATFAAVFGASLSECQGSKTPALCANATCMPSYDPVAGNSCTEIFSLYTCADIATTLPADCTLACPVAGNSSGADGGVDAAGGMGGGGTGGRGGAAPGSNLIINGDFSDDLTDWKITQQAGSVSIGGVTNGQLCVTLGAYTTVTIGWPSDTSTVFSLQTGVTYQLSYQARTTAGLPQFEVQVGQGVPPYTQIDFMTTADVPGSQILTFTHGFSLSTPEPQGGMAFNIVSGPASASTVCVAHVSLVSMN